MILSSYSECPFDWLNVVGVAIKNSKGQLHTGLMYVVDDEVPILLHLANHHTLCRSQLNEKYIDYIWSDLPLRSSEARNFIANFLSVVGTHGPRIPYGLNSLGIDFDPNTGDLLPHPDGRGFTCATFIIGVFRALGYILVDLSQWPEDRPGDAEWQQKIVSLLLDIDPVHAEAVKNDLPCVRLRPEEIVGAAASWGWPHGFLATQALGFQVLNDLVAFGLYP